MPIRQAMSTITGVAYSACLLGSGRSITQGSAVKQISLLYVYHISCCHLRLFLHLSMQSHANDCNVDISGQVATSLHDCMVSAIFFACGGKVSASTFREPQLPRPRISLSFRCFFRIRYEVATGSVEF